MEYENMLIPVAMNIILHAGDARTLITEALSLAKKGDFKQAKSYMNRAEEEIVLAHKSQTETIQDEARGVKHDISLLFIHAQDTLMTINSEFRLAQHLIDILQLIFEEKGK